MSADKVLGIVILVLAAPTLLVLAVQAVGVAGHAVFNPGDPANVERATNLTADVAVNQATPWWAEPVTWLAGSPLLLVAFLGWVWYSDRWNG